jgi:hypothetical protein
MWHIFEAPDGRGELTIPPSPWHSGGLVRLPEENWSLILEFAAKRDASLARELEHSSQGTDETEDEVRVSPDRLERLASFGEEISNALHHAPPLVPEANEQVPDAFTNAEHARMVDAVAAVMRASARSGRPFRAWVE